MRKKKHKKSRIQGEIARGYGRNYRVQEPRRLRPTSFVVYPLVLLGGVFCYWWGVSGRPGPDALANSRNPLDTFSETSISNKPTLDDIAVDEGDFAPNSADTVRQFLSESADSSTSPTEVHAETGVYADASQTLSLGTRSDYQPEMVSAKDRGQETPSRLSYVGLDYPRLSSLSELRRAEAAEGILDLESGEKVVFAFDPRLQSEARKIIEELRVPWGSLVAVHPKTGRVLALAGHSEIDDSGDQLPLRATFPAASLFKVITSAAAVEESGVTGQYKVNYRGGDHTLTRANFQANSRTDGKSMTLKEALGKSCNPVFARIALGDLAPSALERYSRSFGFNSPIPFEFDLQTSTFSVETDDYSIARTAAGFGRVNLSPLHAALITASIANRGIMMRPFIVDRVEDSKGTVLYRAEVMEYKQAVLPGTAQSLMTMMQETTTNGTAKRYFKEMLSRRFPGIEIAGKTGTLRGLDPEGTYFWFVAALPAKDPELVVSALVIDPGYRGVKGTLIASRFIARYLGGDLGNIDDNYGDWEEEQTEDSQALDEEQVEVAQKTRSL